MNFTVITDLDMTICNLFGFCDIKVDKTVFDSFVLVIFSESMQGN